jgi:hypothetical protein
LRSEKDRRQQGGKADCGPKVEGLAALAHFARFLTQCKQREDKAIDDCGCAARDKRHRDRAQNGKIGDSQHCCELSNGSKRA